MKTDLAWRVGLWATYGTTVTLAVVGQYQAGVLHLQPVTGWQHAGLIGIAVGIEAIAAAFAARALRRGLLGESVRLLLLFAILFAGLSAGINIVGHWPELYSTLLFGGASSAAVTLFIVDIRAHLRDSWDPHGHIRTRVPGVEQLRVIAAAMGPDYSRTEVMRRARFLAQQHAERVAHGISDGTADTSTPGMAPVAALTEAHAQIRAEAERRMLLDAVEATCKEQKLSPTKLRLAMLAYGNTAVTETLSDLADHAALARALYSKITPDKITGVQPDTLAPVRLAARTLRHRPTSGQPDTRPDTTDRPERPVSGQPETSARTPLDIAYERFLAEHDRPPSSRELATVSGYSKSTAHKWMVDNGLPNTPDVSETNGHRTSGHLTLDDFTTS